MGKAGQEAKKKRKLRERLGLEGPYSVPTNGTNGHEASDHDIETEDIPGLPVSSTDLTTASRVLSILASSPGVLSPSSVNAKFLKPVRRAVHHFFHSENDASQTGNSLASKISLALSSGRFLDARVLLSEMMIRKVPPKLGQLQRWVRDCDAAGTSKATSAEDRVDVWRALEGILRITGDFESQGTDNGEGEPTDEYGKGAPVFKRAVWTMGERSGETPWSDLEAGKLFAPDEAEELKVPFRVVLNTPGANRQPPNEHPAVIWASSPASIPITAASPVTRHDHPSVPGCFLLSNVLSHEDCRTILRHLEAVGYLPDRPLSDSKDSVLAHNVYWLADTSFMSQLWDRVKDLLPQSVDGGKLVGVNARFRCYRYVPGAVYRPHIDGAWPGSGLDEEGNYVYDMNAGKTPAVWSRLTFLVYLNDDFEKGWTTFFVPRNGKSGLDAHPVEPRMGSVLVFPHGDARGSLLHEGSGVGSNAKFIIRTDVLYEIAGKGARLEERVDGN